MAGGEYGWSPSKLPVAPATIKWPLGSNVGSVESVFQDGPAFPTWQKGSLYYFEMAESLCPWESLRNVVDCQARWKGCSQMPFT